MTHVLRGARASDDLERLATWTYEELMEELRNWSDQEILNLWKRLEPLFRRMCSRFGLIPPHRRVYEIHLHQQIRRLGVLQSLALQIERNQHLGG